MPARLRRPARASERPPGNRRRHGFRSIRTKLLGLGALATLLLVGVGTFAAVQLAEVRDRSDRQAQLQATVGTALSELSAATWNAQMRLYAVAASPPDAKSAATAQARSAFRALDEAAAALEGAFTAAGAPPAVWDEFSTGLEGYQTIREPMLELAAADDRDGFSDLRSGGGASTINALNDHLAAVEDEVSSAMIRDAAEADAIATRAGLGTITVGAFGALLSLALTLGIAGQIVRSVAVVKRSVDALATGDLTVVPGARSKDELGDMAAAVEAALAHLRSLVQEVATTAHAIGTSAGELSVAQRQVSEGAEETTTHAEEVSRLAAEVSASAGQAAAGAEHVSASIRDVAHSAAGAAQISRESVDVASATSASIDRLEARSRQIDEVVRTITEIAERTNLLALNATIEAARAGEAGKGFAVVAQEVKELARKTGAATELVAVQVQGIQTEASSAVAAIRTITELIDGISGRQTEIAAAVEEQTAATNDIAEAVSLAAENSGNIAARIAGVSTASAESTRLITGLDGAAADLARMAAELRLRTDAFRTEPVTFGNDADARRFPGSVKRRAVGRLGSWALDRLRTRPAQ